MMTIQWSFFVLTNPVTMVNDHWLSVVLSDVLIIANGKGWHCLAVKKLSALLRGITSKDYNDFYYLNCLHSSTTKNKLEWQKNFCNLIMPSENTTILEFNQYQTSDKAPFIVYAGREV